MTVGEQMRAAHFLQRAAGACIASAKSMPRDDVGLRAAVVEDAAAYLRAARYLIGCASNSDGVAK